ncbi:acetyltransferase [Paenibacillus sp. FSL H8-0548]|uniref:acyltransferase n=1 Tax=Paenibacillus sp. FSL H8-0548 TaxID=1920422 RepID=UPI00096CB410|nr:acyltransferase [Paenibacillus sp. FSL H8-0548]OMF32608.1 acetyltransferase [Paenibacillus sp. FSL H8-0548]
MLQKIIYRLKRKLIFNKLKRTKGLTFGTKLKVIDSPIVDIRNGGKIVMGNNVTLNSRNKGYHINMHSPVKLYADRPNAEIIIGDNTRIHGTCIHAYEKISIGKNCLIAANTQIIDGSGHDLSFDNPSNRINTIGDSNPVVIKNNVWIGANSIILPGVTIGEGSVIAAGSVVTRNIPPMVVAGGNPAKVIKSVDSINVFE